MRLDALVGVLLLWTASVVLCIKYSMIAKKVAIAITEQNVVKRSNYKRIVYFFGVLYSLSFVFFVCILIVNITALDNSKTFEN